MASPSNYNRDSITSHELKNFTEKHHAFLSETFVHNAVYERIDCIINDEQFLENQIGIRPKYSS